jgi:hypothetical protein
MKKLRVLESKLYEPIKAWFEKQGFTAEIAAGKSPKILIPIGNYLGVSYVEPDVVACKKNAVNKIVTVEAKTDPMYIFDGLGRCVILKAIVDFAYLALPDYLATIVKDSTLFESIGVGLLSVSETGNVEEIVKAKMGVPYLPELYQWFRNYVEKSIAHKNGEKHEILVMHDK